MRCSKISSLSGEEAQSVRILEAMGVGSAGRMARRYSEDDAIAVRYHDGSADKGFRNFTTAMSINQREIYQLLHTKGSHWLKTHVLFADRKIVVVNKPPDFVCQLNHKSKVSVVTAFLVDNNIIPSRSTDTLPS